MDSDEKNREVLRRERLAAGWQRFVEAREVVRSVGEFGAIDVYWADELRSLAQRILLWIDAIVQDDFDAFETQKKLDEMVRWCESLVAASSDLESTHAQQLAADADYAAGGEATRANLVDAGSNAARVSMLMTSYRQGAAVTYGTFAPVIARAVQQSGKQRDFFQLANKTMAEMAGAKQETESATRAARAATQELITAQEARNFRSQGRMHNRQARRWMTATKWCVGLVLGSAAISLASSIWLACTKVALDNGHLIQLGLGKVTLLAVLTSLAVACYRAYAAETHNSTVNNHRAHVLETYRALAESAATPELRAAILTKVTDSIFVMHPTGFVKGAAEAPGLPAALIQMIGDVQRGSPKGPV